MTNPSYLLQMVAGYRLNFSPKVSVPAFIGLVIISVCCELEHYGFKVPWSAVALGTVNVMIYLGYLIPDPARANSHAEVAHFVANSDSPTQPKE